ncbi:hypothetical protein E2C01_085965 [Portunus trituberculatus]|uniref:Uncharacterized protein n=1 Tax=Portunus trituberculatus TaxID=210409 RepID=A0A5B7JC59_PORTR|nr:hypothetical protein [Portunus trituberculatus]
MENVVRVVAGLPRLHPGLGGKLVADLTPFVRHKSVRNTLAFTYAFPFPTDTVRDDEPKQGWVSELASK